MDAFIALMQVGQDGDWHDLGLPEVVIPDGGLDGEDAVVDWLFRHHPGASADGWQLLAWTGIREKPWRRDQPDIVLGPKAYHAAVAERSRNNGQSQMRRRSLTGHVLHKVQASAVDLGSRILITQDPANTSADPHRGPWFPARDASPDAVAVRVRGVTVTTRRGRSEVGLQTPLGELSGLTSTQSVIPVDEEH